jgi:glucose/arabinose dehydrogenase
MKSMNVVFAVVLVVVCAGALAVAPALGQVLPYPLKIEQVLEVAPELGDVAQAPTGELWLLERAGTVRVFRAGVEVASLPVGVDTTCESGLLDVAFAPGFGTSGLAFLYYVDSSGSARVDEVIFGGGELALGSTILDLGDAGDGCRPGGGLLVGEDGKLYVGVGDLGDGSNAQDDGSLAGKVLRVELDGSVPPDNASGTRVWAKGFRDAADLALNPHTARTGGTLYLADRGSSSAHDEANEIHESGNYGWDAVSGPDGAGGYDDPLEAFSPTQGLRGIAALGGSTLGADAEGALVQTYVDDDLVRWSFLTGPERDQLEATNVLFDPDADSDGTPDSGCPHDVRAVAEAADGALYAHNDGANAGLWRVWNDQPGPREVSRPGSPFPLTVEKAGSDVTIGWEHLGTIDAGRPENNAGQHAELYQVWEGSLPIDGAYDHAAVLATDGTPEGLARRTATITPADGDRYFLLSAQGDNLEGSLGTDSAGAARPGQEDYCDAIGWGTAVGQCGESWVHPVDGTTLYLIDYNPASPTYMQEVTLDDFRGQVIRLDISADNCFWCDVQADYIHGVYDDFGARDFMPITVLTLKYAGIQPIPPEQCATVIGDWAARNNEDTPILCDTDHDNDNRGDVSDQWWNSTCGTPQNNYIDQGHVVYEFKCGAELSEAAIAGHLVGKINDETCE